MIVQITIMSKMTHMWNSYVGCTGLTLSDKEWLASELRFYIRYLVKNDT